MKLLLSLKFFISSRIYKPASRWYRSNRWEKKIERMLKRRTTKKLSTSQKKEIQSFYQKYGISDVNSSWHRFYTACNDNFSVGYIPENIFYVDIETKLNQESYAWVLADKNLLDKLFPEIKQPETIIKNINGFFFARNKMISIDEAARLCNTSHQMFIKPTNDTGGGKNVRSFTCNAGITNQNGAAIEEFLSSYKKDFIVQKGIEQHELISALNPTSLNTFRVMTYLRKDEIVVLSIVIRIGKKGSVTDNSTTGGISCGVKNDGRLNETGFHLSGDSTTQTDMGIKFKETTLPFMDKIHSTVQKLHKSSPFFRVISWDLAVDVAGYVVLIEYNILGQGINIHQLNNGPVLSELLTEIKS